MSTVSASQMGKFRLAGIVMIIVWTVKLLYALLILHSFSAFVGAFGGGILIFPLLLLFASYIAAFAIIRGKKLITAGIALIYFIGMVALTISGFADPLYLVLDWFVVILIMRAAGVFGVIRRIFSR